MISSGIRVSSLVYLRWKDFTPIERSGKIVAAKINAFNAKTKKYYYTFCTVEAYYAVKEWMDFRASFGERITGESFTDSLIALNYIRDLSDFNDLLIVLDIRMKDLNGFQLYQQIKSIDPTIKILFVTALDILDELLSIVPGISKDQIMRKPIDEKIFTNTVKKMLK